MTTNQIADIIIADLEYREADEQNCTIDSNDHVFVQYDITSMFITHFGTPGVTPDETTESRSIYIHNAGFWVDGELKEWGAKLQEEVQELVNDRLK